MYHFELERTTRTQVLGRTPEPEALEVVVPEVLLRIFESNAPEGEMPINTYRAPGVSVSRTITPASAPVPLLCIELICARISPLPVIG